MFAVFFFLIFLFLPFAFIDSGGSKNNANGYSFLLIIAVTYLFKGWKRIFLVSGLVLIFMALHALEYFYPDLIMVYSDWNQFVDRMIQIPFILTASFFIIQKFAKEYEQANAKLEEYARVDSLTGLYNRRMFDQGIKEAVASRNKPVCLALIDVDNFKKINDGYGHGMGDEVPKKLADLLQDAFGEAPNSVSRWGGDEFAIIFYGEESTIKMRMKQIQDAFQSSIWPCPIKTSISYSIIASRGAEQVEQILAQADRSLYLQKRRKQENG
ncbi:MAG: GGDEF domain-containing protein [Candidatus Pelethousia sp.]|nr:GGDEF domain-containing protein [Candidatus Pelethousia sp.]